MPNKSPTIHPDEKKLQILFAALVALVVVGIVVFVVLLIRDMQH
jgi:hypothetical protein